MTRVFVLASVAALIASAIVAIPAFAATPSIGIFPTSITVTDALRGGEYYKTIGVINDSGAAGTFNVSATGQIASWATFVDALHPAQTVTSFTAQPRGYVGLRLRIPHQLANGTYGGVVHVRPQAPIAAPTRAGASSQSVNVGADIAVTVTVTGTQIVRGALLDSRAPPKIEAGYRLRLRNIVENRGNVQIQPTFNIALAGNGHPSGAPLSFRDRTVDPGATATIETDWKTTAATPVGSYAARVTASAQGVALGAREVRFEVVPYGSLRRNGVFDDLRVTNKPTRGEAALVEARFRNTGEIETNVSFVGELERNGHLVRSVTSVPQLVEAGNVGTIQMVVDVGGTGHYTVTGHLAYEGRRTAARSTVFRVGAGRSALILWLAGAIALVLAGVALWMTMRRRRRSTSLDHRLNRARYTHRSARTGGTVAAKRTNARTTRGRGRRRHDRSTRVGHDDERHAGR